MTIASASYAKRIGKFNLKWMQNKESFMELPQGLSLPNRRIRSANVKGDLMSQTSLLHMKSAIPWCS
jgi:hypothetical protein